MPQTPGDKNAIDPLLFFLNDTPKPKVRHAEHLSKMESLQTPYDDSRGNSGIVPAPSEPFHDVVGQAAQTSSPRKANGNYPAFEMHPFIPTSPTSQADANPTYQQQGHGMAYDSARDPTEAEPSTNSENARGQARTSHNRGQGLLLDREFYLWQPLHHEPTVFGQSYDPLEQPSYAYSRGYQNSEVPMGPFRQSRERFEQAPISNGYTYQDPEVQARSRNRSSERFEKAPVSNGYTYQNPEVQADFSGRIGGPFEQELNANNLEYQIFDQLAGRLQQNRGRPEQVPAQYDYAHESASEQIQHRSRQDALPRP